PNLLIMCAADEDQRSWVSEDYQQTIFAHFVIEGLKGAAAKEGQVSVQDLFDYVKEQVESWVRNNRRAVQTPRLLGPANPEDLKALAEKMIIGSAELSNYKKIDPSTLPNYTPPESLLKKWEERDELARSFPNPWTYTPHLWRRYQDSLLRYEQLLRFNDAG